MHKIVVVLCVCGLALASVARAQAPAAAQPPLDEAALAKQYFERGMAHFQLEEFDAAINKWEDGFRIRPVPEFLYNIAQAYRLSKRPEKALMFYQKYIRMSPKAPNRGEVDKQIAILGKIVEQQQHAAMAPPTGTLPESTSNNPPPTTVTTTVPTTPERPPVAEPAHPQPAVNQPPTNPPDTNAIVSAPPPEKPKTKKWVWGVVGGVAAVVVVAVVVGVVVGTSGGGDNTKSLMDVHF